MELDHIDRKLIDMLNKNARCSLKHLAESVFLSPPAVAARLDRMEKANVITGYHVSVNPEALGYHIKAFINLQVNPADKPVFYPFIEEVPNVVACSCVTGDYSMLIEVLFENTSQLDSFIGGLQRFGKTYTQIVFSTPVEHRSAMVRQED